MGEPSSETAERERRGDKEIYFIAHTSKTHTHTQKRKRKSVKLQARGCPTGSCDKEEVIL